MCWKFSELTVPRKYPDYHTNYYGQKIECGDTVVFVPSTSRKYEGREGRRLLKGTVVKMNMNTVRIEYEYEHRSLFPTEVQDQATGMWKRVHPTEARIAEVNAKPEYVYVLD